MKRTIAIILIAMMTLSASAMAVQQWIDLESMTLDELYELRDQVDAAIEKAGGSIISEDQTKTDEITVWIPKSGKKYHKNASCSNMKNPNDVTESYAKSHGYTICSKCW